MSSATNSSSNFQTIFDVALSDYAKQTDTDLATHPFSQTLQNCDSADKILDLLQDKANQFQAYRDGNRKLINHLKPVVQVLHTVSGILGEAATLVRAANRLACLIASLQLCFQVPFQPAKAILVGVDVLLTVRVIFDFLRYNAITSRYTRPLSESAQVTMPLLIYLNVSKISSTAYEFIPRSLSLLRCLV